MIRIPSMCVELSNSFFHFSQSQGVEVHQLSEEGTADLSNAPSNASARKNKTSSKKNLSEASREKGAVDPCKYKTRMCRSWMRDGINPRVLTPLFSSTQQATALMKTSAAMLMVIQTSELFTRTQMSCLLLVTSTS